MALTSCWEGRRSTYGEMSSKAARLFMAAPKVWRTARPQEAGGCGTVSTSCGYFGIDSEVALREGRGVRLDQLVFRISYLLEKELHYHVVGSINAVLLSWVIGSFSLSSFRLSWVFFLSFHRLLFVPHLVLWANCISFCFSSTIFSKVCFRSKENLQVLYHVTAS